MITELSDSELLELNSQGIIPGPDEKKEAFIARAKYCLSLKNTLSTELKDQIPFKPEELNAEQTLKNPLSVTKKYFDITPNWVPVFFSNHKLGLWHGGCAWIFQMSEQSPVSAFLQLRRAFKQKKRFLYLYNRDEIISHELAHVGRMTYEEPKFEEHFAYKTSTTRFRQFFGPIVQSGKESLIFVLILIMILFADVGLIVSDDLLAFKKIMLINLIPLSFILLGILRLLKRKKQLSKCRKKLNPFSQDHIEHVLYRLTDKEIIDFGKMSQNEVQKYINEQACLRWHLIKTAYDKAF